MLLTESLLSGPAQVPSPQRPFAEGQDPHSPSSWQRSWIPTVMAHSHLWTVAHCVDTQGSLSLGVCVQDRCRLAPTHRKAARPPLWPPAWTGHQLAEQQSPRVWPAGAPGPLQCLGSSPAGHLPWLGPPLLCHWSACLSICSQDNCSDAAGTTAVCPHAPVSSKAPALQAPAGAPRGAKASLRESCGQCPPRPPG